MKFPSLIRLPKYSRFDFQPRYYNPEAEKRQERLDKIKLELSGQPTRNISFSNYAYRRHKKPALAANYRLLFIIVLLTLVCFGYLYYGDIIHQYIETLSSQSIKYALIIVLTVAYLIYKGRKYFKNKRS